MRGRGGRLTTRFYRAWGLSLASQVELPFLIEFGGSGPPDVTIVKSNVPRVLPNALWAGPSWQADHRRLLLRIPGVARFLMTRGSGIEVEAEESCTADDYRIFLVRSALGVILHQRGCFALQACAVEFEGRAVLFCGIAGSGKSSLACRLATQGHRLIADDIAVVRGMPPEILPGGQTLQLRDDVIDTFAFGSKCQPVRPGIPKYLVAPPTPAVTEALPLSAIYFLSGVSPDATDGIEPCGVADAMGQLRRCAFLPGLIGTLGLEASWFSQSSGILEAVPAFDLIRCPGLGNIDGSVDLLNRHWRESLA